MSVPLVLLGLLAEGPAHGYDLKHAYDRRFPGTRALAFGQVYTALSRLERDGLVEVAERTRESGPDRTAYAVTAAGREALRQWLADPAPAGPYAADDLVRKTVVALHLGQDAARFLAAQREVHLAEIRRALDLQRQTGDVAARIVIDHRVEHLDADLRWLEAAVRRVSADRAQPATPDRGTAP